MSQNNLHKNELAMFWVAIATLGIGIYFLGPTITGFVIRQTSYSDNLNLVVTTQGNYTWQLQNPGELKSVRIDGKITNYGKARVYMEDNGIRYLIFDSTRLNESKTIPPSNNSITGFVTNNENHKPEWKSDTAEFNVNQTITINLSNYFSDQDGDALSYSASNEDNILVLVSGEIVTISSNANHDFNTTETFIASDGIDSTSQLVNLVFNSENSQNLTLNDSLANITLETNLTSNTSQNKSILAKLSYNSGTLFDSNDDGLESVNGIVDLNVLNTTFGWQPDESKLCTRWQVYSNDEDKSTTSCYGNAGCCAFVGLLPTRQNWSEIYYASFGKDGAGHANTISAQVIYYDVNLSIENPKSEVYYSGWDNKSVTFSYEENDFQDICADTCDLKGLNKSSYRLVFETEGGAILNIDRIKYSTVIDVKNNAPLLLQNFSTINISINKNLTINLSAYFADPDGDMLYYKSYKADNLTITIDNNTATIKPDRNFEGIRYIYFVANDSDLASVSNVFMINVSRQFYRPSVEIGKKVKWKTIIFVDSENSTSVNLTLPPSASNITVSVLNDAPIKLPDYKIKLIEGGKIKDKQAFESGRNISELKRNIRLLEEAKIKRASKIIDEQKINSNELNSKLVDLYKKKSEIPQAFDALNTSESPKLVINESLPIDTELEVEYETEQPVAIENDIDPSTKRIRIISDTSYENVLSYTSLNDVPRNSIKLYWVKDTGRELFNDVKYYDDNSNGLIDRIEWIVPHLSNQTFEVSITVLNVQSYPTVFGNWTVAFNTTGTGNLTIFAYNGTTYAEYYNDSNLTANDLDILELKCGSNILFNKYDLINNASVYLVGSNDDKLKINDTTSLSLPIKSIYAQNYNCDNLTGYWTVKVLTTGVHNQRFNFSEQIADAHNFASALGSNINGSKNILVDDTDTDFYKGNLTSSNLITSMVVGTGAGANVTINVSSLQNQTQNLPNNRFFAPNASTVLLMHFEEGQGQYANDSGFYSQNNGTLGANNAVNALNDPVWNSTTKFGSFGLTYNGSQYVTVPQSQSINNFTSISVEAWIYPKLDFNPMIIRKNLDTPSSNYGLYQMDLNNGIVRFLISVSGSISTLSSTSTISSNNWYYLVGTYDGTTMRLFINGVQDNTKSASGSVNTSTQYSLFIGGTELPSNFFNGTIDEVAIWNVSLDNATIQKHYQQGWGYFNYSNFTSQVFYANATVNWSYVSWSQEANDKGVSNLYQTDISDLINASTVLYMKFNNDTLESERPLNLTYNVSAETNLVLYMPFDNVTGESERQVNETFNISNTASLLLDMPFDSAAATEIVPNGSTILLMHFNNDTGTGENSSLFLNNATYANGAGIGNGTCRFDLGFCPIFNDSSAKLGKSALQFDGINDFVNLTRFGNITPTDEITVEFWQYAQSIKQQSVIFVQNGSSSNRINIHTPWSDGVIYWDFGDIATSGRLSYTPQSPLTNTWQHFAMTASKSGNYMKIYRNGVLEASKFGMTSYVGNNSDLSIGQDYIDSNSFFNGSIDELVIWNVSLSPQIIAQHSGYGIDRSIYTNNATLMNGTINQSGKFGAAMQFDGIGSYVDVANKSYFDFTKSSKFSACAWINLHTTKPSGQTIISKKTHGNQDSGWELNANNFGAADSNGIQFILSSSTGSDAIHVYTSTNLTPGSWYHVCSTYDGSSTANGVKIFIDGVSNQYTVQEDDLSSSTVNAVPVRIGMRTNTTITPFNGMIDEVSVWNVTLSQDKIAEMAGEKTLDYSIYRNNGTYYTNESPSFGGNFTAGKFGKALVFNGLNNYVNLSNSSTLKITNNKLTLEAWINTNSLSGIRTIVGRWGNTGSTTGSHLLYLSGGYAYFSVSTTGADITSALTPSPLLTNQWYHVAGVYDGSNVVLYLNGVRQASTAVTGNIYDNPRSALIGAYDFDTGPTGFFSGSIDEVAIWNKTLTPDKIAEHAGAKILDYSIYGNNGTHFTNISANFGTNFTAGKFGKALVFDGVKDYVNITNTSSLNFSSFITAQAWVKVKKIQSSKNTIIDNREFSLDMQTNNFNFFVAPGGAFVSGASTSVPLQDDTWYHVTGTFDGGLSSNNNKIYLNGILAGSATNTGSLGYASSDRSVYVGRVSGGSFFNGSIDEVSLWNVSLSADDIKRQYERGVLNLNLSYRTSNDNSTWSQWTGAPNNSLSAITPNVVSKYFQYKIDFNTSDPRFTPILNNVTINYSLMNNLSTWDDTDFFVRVIGQPIRFYANFTSGGSSINGTGISCTFSNNLSGSWGAATTMSFNSTPGIYFIDSQFVTNKTSFYNISCDATALGYNKINIIDSFIVYPSLNITLNLNATTVSPGGIVSVSGHVNLSNGTNLSNSIINIFLNNVLMGLNNLTGFGTYNVKQFIDDSDTDFINGNISTNSQVVGAGAGANLTINASSLLNQTQNLPRGIATNASTVLYLKFEEGQGQYANDSSQYFWGNGTLGATNAASGDDPVWNSSAKLGSFGLTFNGINTLVNLTLNSSIKGLSSASIEAWINPINVIDGTATGQRQRIYYESTPAGGGTTRFGIAQNGSSIQNVFRVSDAASTLLNSPSILQNNTWSYVVTTIDTNEVKLFVNGLQVASAPSGLTAFSNTAPSSILIGANDLNQQLFNGTIDELAVWNVSLDNATIQQHYRNGFGYFNTSNFTSQIYDARSIANWSYISWSQEANDKGVSNQYQNDLSDLINASTVLYMKFNNDSSVGENYNLSNGTLIYDYSPRRNNGTMYGNTSGVGLNYSPTGGKLAGAYVFDGINDFVNISTYRESTPSLTVEAWFNPKDNLHQDNIISQVDAASTARGLLYLESATGGTIKTNIGSTTLGSFVPQLNTWTHAAATFDGAILRVYVNGVLTDSIATTIECSNCPLVIGVNKVLSANRFFNGSIDEVAVWNVSLSADDIKRQYERGVLSLNLSYRTSNDSSTWTQWSGVPNNSISTVNTLARYFQYQTVFGTNDSRFTPILNNVTINYTGIFTDYLGNYNYTFTSPSTAGTYTIKVNTTWANTIPGEQSSQIIVQQSQTINLAAGGAFYIQNSSGSNIAIIDSLGNMNIKGTLTSNAEPTSGAKDFAIQNSSGGLNLVVTNPDGNLLIKGSISQNQPSLNTTLKSFIIQNNTGNTVAYVNSTGGLFLVGSLTQNVVFS